MNTYEMFTKIKEHLLRQGEKSIKDGNYSHCSYRGDGGMKCAVGALINDENYCPMLEGKVINFFTVKYAVEDSVGRSLSKKDMLMLSTLQSLHDGFPPEHWGEQLYHEERLLRRNGVFGGEDQLRYKPETYPPPADVMFKNIDKIFANKKQDVFA